MPKVAITGANGFIGSYLAKKFFGAGWRVIALQRRATSSDEKIKTVPFNINQQIDDSELHELDLLVHCAWQPYSKKSADADAVNQQGTIALQKLAHRNGAKFIFLSTLSAHEAATSHYGKSKLLTENSLDNSKDLTLKIGLVIGESGGFIRKISPVLKKSKFIPLIEKGEQPVQTLDVDDLFMVIAKSFEKKLCGNYAVAESQAHSVFQLYKLMSEQLKVKPFFINAPYSLIYAVIQIAAKIFPLPVNTENLKGLKQYRAFDTSAIQKELGIQFISARESIEKAYQLFR